MSKKAHQSWSDPEVRRLKANVRKNQGLRVFARSAGLDIPNYRLETLMDLIGFEIRVRPMHSTLVGAQAVADVFRFLLKRCYHEPTHEGVKDMLIFRTDRMHVLAGRIVERCKRYRAYV